jgi:hypothetical protein
MGFKSWFIPYLGITVGVGFTIYSFVTGNAVNETHVQLLDYLLYLTLGSGAIGAANSGFKKYSEYKAK